LYLLINGQKEPFTVISTGSAGGSKTSPLLIGDIDGDGRLDVVARQDSNGTYAWRLDVTRSILHPSREMLEVYETGDIFSNGGLLACLDLNGDGIDEVVGFSRSAIGSQSQLVVLSSFEPISEDRGRFHGIAHIPLDVPHLRNPIPVISDVDGDGRADLLLVESVQSQSTRVPDSNSARVMFLRNQGDGTMQSSNWYDMRTSDYVTSVVYKDVSGDGVDDLVLLCTQTDGSPSTVRVYVRTDTGYTEHRYRLRDGRLAVQLHTADFDADGDCDLLSVLKYPVGVGDQSGLMQLWRQGETGTFGYPGEIPVLHPRVVMSEAGDFNGDGAGDIAYSDDINVVYEGMNMWTVQFKVRVLMSTAAKPGRVTLVGPVEEQQTVDGLIDFRWTDSLSASSYRLEVARDEGFCDVLSVTSVSGTSTTVQLPLVAEAEWFWRVWAVNSNGITKCDPLFRSFVVEDLNLIDCNGNGRYDWDDVRLGFSVDVNENGLPDECERCPADANGDNQVDGADLSVLLFMFGQPTAPFNAADFNGDGIVNGADLSVLLFRFGQSC